MTAAKQQKVYVNEPTAYYGEYNEIAAAGQLYSLTIEVVVAGTDFPPPPAPPAPNTLHVLYHPHSCHYWTLTPSYKCVPDVV